MSYDVLFVEGLAALKDLDNLPKEIIQAARKAVNGTLRWTRTDSARRITKIANFPISYLNPSGGRLEVARYATDEKLEGAIVGRQRATSLARFVTSGSLNKPGATVSVKPGASHVLKRAFLVRLRAGSKPIDTKSNLGLAVRLSNAQRLRNKTKMTQLGKGLYLLYGPSVDQAFRFVSSDIQPQALDRLEDEFLRLMEI